MFWNGGLKRRSARAALTLGLLAVIGAIAAPLLRDPWPPSEVFQAPPEFADCGFAFCLDGRAFHVESTSNPIAWDLRGRPISIAPDAMVVHLPVSARDGRSYVGFVGPVSDPAQAVIARVDLATGTVRKLAGWSEDRRILNLELADEDRSARAWMAGDGTDLEVVTWDLATGAESRRTIPAPPRSRFGELFSIDARLANSPDGRLLALRTLGDQQIQLWDVAANRPVGEPLRPQAVDAGPASHAWFALDGRALVIVRDEGRLEVWDVAQRTLIRTIRPQPPGAAFGHATPLPGGRTALSYSVTNPRPERFPWLWRNLPSFGLPWSMPSGKAVVVDLATGRILARAHDVRMALVAPGGRTVVTRHFDGTTAIRPVPEPEP